MEIDITSDINAAIKEVGDFFNDQIPFVMAGAITDTAFSARHVIVNETYPAAFDVKNARLPGVMFKITKDGSATRSPARALKSDLKTGGSTHLDIGDVLGRDYMVRHAEGGTKTPQGQHIAVPVQPGTVRGASGRVLASKKPLTLGQKKNHYILRRGGEKKVLMRRGRGGANDTAIYLFIRQAGIDKRFMFYEDMMTTVTREFPMHFEKRKNRAIRTSRFT